MSITFTEEEITGIANRLANLPYNQVADIIGLLVKKLEAAKQEPKEITNGNDISDTVTA